MLDIHTHHNAPQLEGVINVSPLQYHPIENQAYSVGIHPWETLHKIEDATVGSLRKIAHDPRVKAIGETGYDALKGGPAFQQLLLFKTHIELSEETKKPLIIHDVKAHDIIIGCHRDMKPTQQWMVHGFRGKPEVAEMFLRAGIWLSLGEVFNPQTLDYLLTNAPEHLLAETDESSLTIYEILQRMEDASKKSGHSVDIPALIRDNTARFLELGIRNEE